MVAAQFIVQDAIFLVQVREAKWLQQCFNININVVISPKGYSMHLGQPDVESVTGTTYWGDQMIIQCRGIIRSKMEIQPSVLLIYTATWEFLFFKFLFLYLGSTSRQNSLLDKKLCLFLKTLLNITSKNLTLHGTTYKILAVIDLLLNIQHSQYNVPMFMSVRYHFGHCMIEIIS